MESPVSQADEALRSQISALGLDWCVVARQPLPRGRETRLCGVWLAPTADLLKMRPPAPDLVQRGRFDGTRMALFGTELGAALVRLLEGDSWLLDAIFSHCNLMTSEVHEHLLERVRDGLHKGHVDHYLTHAERAADLRTPTAQRRAAALLLQAIHLARTGQVSTDFDELARVHGVTLDTDLDALRANLRDAGAAELLPPHHPRPEAFDEFLLFVREARW